MAPPREVGIPTTEQCLSSPLENDDKGTFRKRAKSHADAS
jgi:hypothetical protein